MAVGSLNAVWCAYLAMASLTASEIGAERGVSLGRTILQARYYDCSKGAFLSEDPVFNGDPKPHKRILAQRAKSVSVRARGEMREGPRS